MRLGKLAGTLRRLECWAKTFSAYPTENGKSITNSFFSENAIQTWHEGLWILQKNLRHRAVSGATVCSRGAKEGHSVPAMCSHHLLSE